MINLLLRGHRLSVDQLPNHIPIHRWMLSLSRIVNHGLITMLSSMLRRWFTLTSTSQVPFISSCHSLSKLKRRIVNTKQWSSLVWRTGLWTSDWVLPMLMVPRSELILWLSPIFSEALMRSSSNYKVTTKQGSKRIYSLLSVHQAFWEIQLALLTIWVPEYKISFICL